MVYTGSVNSRLRDPHTSRTAGGDSEVRLRELRKSRISLSLLESLGLLERLTGKRTKIRYSGWRLSDQEVYVSDISKAKERLKWSPKVSLVDGLQKLINWVSENRLLPAEPRSLIRPVYLMRKKLLKRSKRLGLFSISFICIARWKE